MIRQFVSKRPYSTKFPSRIPNEEYGSRRNSLLKKVFDTCSKEGDDRALVILRGTRQSFIAPDVPFPFRQCSNFRYLTGIHNVPDCVYVMYATAEDKYDKILFTDKRSDYQELWEGKLPSEDELQLAAGFDQCLPLAQLPKIVESMVSPKCSIFCEPSQWNNTSILSKFAEMFSKTRTLFPLIHQLRVVKSSNELASMRDVCSIGGQMISNVIPASRSCDSEAEIVGLLEYNCRKLGAEMLSYPPVVAAGNRANTVHYLDGNRSINKGDTVLVDAGCDLNGYVSDITRCWPIGTFKWSSPQLRLYEALLDVHQQLLQYANVMEKVRLSKIYDKMIDLLRDNMTEIGLIPAEMDKNSRRRMAEELCPHHVSHYLGMDVHDCTSISRDIDLPPNVVFTIEPGVYVPLDSDFPKEFQGIGYRIEDDVITTTKGIENLSDHVPKSPSQIESLLN